MKTKFNKIMGAFLLCFAVMFTAGACVIDQQESKLVSIWQE